MIRCFSISFNVNFRHLRHVFGRGRPLSEDFTGVTTSSRRYLWRRHLGFKMAAPEMTSTKTWGGLFGPHWGGGAIWRPFRFRPPSWMTSFPGPENWEWGHPRWRPDAEGPPYCASASMGIEKAALYYCDLCYWPFVGGIHQWPVDFPHKGPVMGKCVHAMTPSWPSVHHFKDYYTKISTLKILWK